MPMNRSGWTISLAVRQSERRQARRGEHDLKITVKICPLYLYLYKNSFPTACKALPLLHNSYT